jgi:hypothetical protein
MFIVPFAIFRDVTLSGASLLSGIESVAILSPLSLFTVASKRSQIAPLGPLAANTIQPMVNNVSQLTKRRVVAFL